MIKFKILNKRNIIIFLIGCMLIGVLAHLTLGFIFFPDIINVKVGEKTSFNFNIPAKATIYSEDISVMNINSEQVEDNIEISLNEPVMFHADNIGNANMQLKILGIPVKNVKLSVLPEIKLVPCGKTVGIRIDTNGVLVLGTGEVSGMDGKVYNPCKNVLKSGDLILKADGIAMTSKEDLISAVENCNKEKIPLEIKRNDSNAVVNIEIVKGERDNKNKIGVWVRDSTQGIGTVTYYDRIDGSFGSLGHPITDVDTKQIISVKSGSIMKSKILSVKKGEKGSPGELIGEINKSAVIGDITTNNEFGVYGKLEVDEMDKYTDKELNLGFRNEVEIGQAYILSNIDGNKIEKYNINIEGINKYNTDDSKGMVIKITDERLLNKTNGIVQGMSGSPIIQNDKLVGAVTHVFVQDSAKGYGIFAETMIQNSYK